MDKKWRNLLIIIVLIIAIVAGYLYFSQNTLPLPLVESKSIDEGYTEILNIFEKNDVNIENVQLLSMVDSDQNGNVIWVEQKSNLNNAKSDLMLFRSNLGGYSALDANELNNVALIYVHAIDYALLSSSRMETVSQLIKKGISCNDKSLITDINTALGMDYVDKYNLAAEVDDFAYNFDPYSEIIIIDLEKEYSYYSDVSGSLNNIVSNCEGIN